MMELSVTERSLFYCELARWFSFPQEDLYLSLKEEGGLLEALSVSLPDPPPALEELQEAYTNLFDVGMGGPPCPLYEGSYVGWGRTQLFEELLRFYEFFGLELSPSGRELPDHLTVELEFMHYLTFQEAQAEDPFPYRLAQRDFLSRHLAHWVPLMAERLAQKTESGLFARLGEVLCSFTRADLSALEQMEQD
ncbi:MAG: molecular chaperone TorD family protein [Candidatus Tectomicrobia bacterium]|uniref:Molecular chaperone TorD family protein n=1 Tax=Tectimicrobiota bacterium TaxID=2528274 RepID=A0A932CR60_UNCTE|nr:molecular chaperone TorD family protein [Candidatus Tectomicrobia bacterium]